MIQFATALEGQTLTLTCWESAVTRSLTIEGDHDHNDSMVTLSGNDASRILHIAGGTTDATVQDLGLQNALGPGDFLSLRRSPLAPR